MRITSALSSVLLLTIFISPLVLAERFSNPVSGPSAKGEFEILQTQDLQSRSIEFSAETTADGKTIGQAIYQDNPPSNSHSSPEAEAEKPFFLRAELDCLVVKTNKAVMSGSITEASSANYVGRRFLLVVQDNGASENPLKHDKLTWGLYRVMDKNWVAADAERPDENGPLSWMVADAERPEDPGTFPDNNPTIGCHTFPVSTFSFLDDATSRGIAHVKP